MYVATIDFTNCDCSTLSNTIHTVEQIAIMCMCIIVIM